MLDSILRALAAPVLAVLDRSDRVYVGYLLGAGLLAVAFWAKKVRGKQSLLGYLFPARIWLHRSALFDVRFMVARALLDAFLLGPLVFGGASLALTIGNQLRQVATPSPILPSAVALGLVTFLAFLCEDLARFCMHRLMHQVPALFEIHKVHHSAEVLTPLTVHRTHPIEAVLMRCTSAIGLASGAAASAWLLGVPLRLWEILGVQALSLVWNAAGSNLRHSHVFLCYPKFLNRILLSPAAHQIHHSNKHEHFDKNFGAVFSFWDAWAKTLHTPTGEEKLTFGLSKAEQNHHDQVLSALFSPLVAASRRLIPAEFAERKSRSRSSQGATPERRKAARA